MPTEYGQQPSAVARWQPSRTTSSLAGTTGRNAPACHREAKRVPLRSSHRGPQIALFHVPKLHRSRQCDFSEINAMVLEIDATGFFEEHRSCAGLEPNLEGIQAQLTLNWARLHGGGPMVASSPTSNFCLP